MVERKQASAVRIIQAGDEWVDRHPVGVLQELDAIYLSKTQDDTTSGQLTATGGFVGDLTGSYQVAVENTIRNSSKPTFVAAVLVTKSMMPMLNQSRSKRIVQLSENCWKQILVYFDLLVSLGRCSDWHCF